MIGPEPGQRIAVQRGPRIERDRESQMRTGLVAPSEALQALAEREMSVVRGRIKLEEPFEGVAGPFGLVRVEIGTPECLEDRGLPRLEPIRALEDDRSLRVMTTREQLVAALEQVVGGLGRSVGIEGVGTPIHDPMVARNPATRHGAIVA